MLLKYIALQKRSDYIIPYFFMVAYPFILLILLNCLTLAACSSGGGGSGIVISPVIWSDETKDGPIVGTVVDQLGNPVPQVAIYFSSAPVSRISYTDNNGKFSIASYPLGGQLVRFEKSGYAGAAVQALLTSSKQDLGTIRMAFGDANADGAVDSFDVSLYQAVLGTAVTNFNRFMDFDGNGVIDAQDLDIVNHGVGTRGLQCSEWLISKPDYVAYIPVPYNSFTTNQHYLVTQLNNGRLLGVWTAALTESCENQSVVCNWSDDGGKTWSGVNMIAGPPVNIASWGFPVYVPEKNRVYVFYNRDVGSRIYQHGYLAMKYSDDGGETWSNEYLYVIPPGEYSPQDPGNPPYWWAYQKPIRIGDKFVVGFTEILPHEPDIYYSTEIRFLSFDNIATISDPNGLKITAFPVNGAGLKGGGATESLSTLQEPSLVQLSDGRLFCVMRSGRGFPYYSISADNGKTWTTPAGLRYGDGQPLIDQPLASCPIYKLSDSSYVLVFHNNDGTANGGTDPGDGTKNRSPAFIAYAQESLTNVQPLTFNTPVRFLENYVRPYGPQFRTEIGTYPSMTVINGTPILWYPDRKYFLLGKRLPKPS